MAEVSGGIWVLAKTEPSFEKEGCLRPGPERPALAANLARSHGVYDEGRLVG
jgi:hypothetical protein